MKQAFNDEVQTVCDIYANAIELKEAGIHVIKGGRYKPGVANLKDESVVLVANCAFWLIWVITPGREWKLNKVSFMY